jgi:hypothetical protein
VPPAAVVSASAAIHPHLAHRRVIYIFPTLQEATQLLVDVTDIPGVHPNDAHTQIVGMLDTEWQVIQADQGLILAQKSASNSATPALPDSFYGFARSTAQPTYATPLTFGDDELQLLGYDVHDDPDDGVSFRLYWQASTKLPDDLRVWPLVYDDQGQLLSDPTQVPMIATVWYPPSAWQPGETIVTETLPQLLPDTFHLGLAVGPEDSFSDPSRRWPIIDHKANPAVRLYPGKWAQLGSFNRQGPYLNRFPAISTFNPLTPTDVQFGPAIRLTGYWFESDPGQAGETLPVLLQWTASQPLQADFTVFVHLVAPDGSLVAQSDASPAWLTTTPTSQWIVSQPVLDSHSLALPEELPAGTYSLQIGLYHPQTLERLARPDGSDTFFLGEIEVR